MIIKLTKVVLFLITFLSFRAFAQDVVDFSQCPFTGPAQTWVGSDSGKADIVSASKLHGAVDGKFLGFKNISSQEKSCEDLRSCKADKTLRVAKPSFEYFDGKGQKKTFESDGELPPGKYETVEIYKNAEVTIKLTDTDEFWVGQFIIKENGKLIVESPVELNVNTFTLLDDAVIVHTGSPGDLMIIGHQNGGTIEFNSTNSDPFSAYVIANGTASILGNTHIKGAVISNYLKMDVNAVLTADLSGCNKVEPPLDLDYCELFPSPAQGWAENTSNKITMSNSSQINNAYLNNGERLVGFANSEFNNSSNCDGQNCINDRSLQVNRMSLNEYTVAGTRIINKETEMDPLDPVEYDQMYVDQSNITFNPGHYYFNYLSIDKSVINIIGPVVIHVKRLELSQNSTFNNNGSPDDLVILGYDPYVLDSGDGTFPECPLSIPGHSGCQINFANNNEFKGLIYSEGKVNLSNSVHLTGAVTASYLNMSNHAKITGDSECFDPQPKSTLKITPKSAFGLTCERMPVTFSVRKKNGDLDTDYSGALNASVTSSNPTNSCWALTEDAAECSEEHITTSLPGGQRKLWLQSKTAGDIMVEGTTGDLNDNAGPYRFAPFGFRVNGGDPAKIIAGKTETLLIEAVADTGAKCEVIEDYGKVDGENKSLNINSLDYVQPTTGSKNLDIDGLTLASGGSITQSLQFKQGKALLPVTYNDAGEISFELADDEWKPQDCEANSTDCDDYEGDWKGLKGKAVIQSRPYTFALCGIQSAGGKTDFSGTSSSGNGFAAAGETFSVTFKPIIWTSSLANPDSDNSGDSNNDIVTAGNTWCQVPTTPNYYSVEALNLSAPLNLSIPDVPHSPVPEEGTANKGELGGTVSASFTQLQAKDGLTMSNLTWSEVGSLWLQADATYLGMKLDQGVGALGRFYPHHFALKSSELVDTVPDKFTYMDQAFTASFEAEAQNKADQATLNYGDFAAGYQEELDIVAIDGGVTGTKKNELTPRLDQSLLPSLPPWAKSWSQASLTLEKGAVGFLRDVITSEPKTTRPDGPYDVRVGLAVNTPSGCATRGCTDFADQDLDIRDVDDVTPVKAIALAGNITARYGRLKLDDANSQFDKAVNIPVRAQYWDSSVTAFVLNTDDSTSQFDGSNYCKQMIWPTTPDEVAKSKSIMQGSGTVSSGKSYVLEAIPKRTDYFREQVRFWLRLAKSPQSTESGVLNCEDGNAPTAGDYYRPWLQYNWRDNGDEDPSAVVTFGVYRGNDRIIYRGEKGMNKLLN